MKAKWLILVWGGYGCGLHIGQIRSVRPRGPYALAGFSLGGLIAFEMAQQLMQCGEKVELVALVDSQVDEQCLTFPAWG